MEPRSGRVVNGQIILDEDVNYEEGSRVTVWLSDEGSDPVRVTDEEMKLIREGQAAADAGKLVDARAFLGALREMG